jgi:uncharacterized protein YcfL
MKKGYFILVIVVMLISVMLSGCQDTQGITTTDFRPHNVSLNSTIVEFANVSFEKKMDRAGDVVTVTVGWLFHNIAGKWISAQIDVNFYDKNNVLLYNSTRWLQVMAGYTEKYYSPSANRVTYEGADVASVDHVVISVTEMQ